MKNYLMAAICLMISFQAIGQTRNPHSLIRPVPRDSLREMETDRPDVTESPRTVDAGHFQFETDLFRFEQQRNDPGRTDEYLFNQMNIKLGITSSTAIQLNFETYEIKKTFEEAGLGETGRGFGDITFRIKQNLIGNDSGDFALALLPYLTFPTSTAVPDKRYQAGLIIPMGFKLNKEWKLGMQVEGDWLKDEEEMGHHHEVLQTLALSHSLNKKIEAIIETYYTYDFKSAHFKNFLNAALQIELLKDMRLDGGLNYGLQHDAKRSYFFGLSFRI